MRQPGKTSLCLLRDPACLGAGVALDEHFSLSRAKSSGASWALRGTIDGKAKEGPDEPLPNGPSFAWRRYGGYRRESGLRLDLPGNGESRQEILQDFPCPPQLRRHAGRRRPGGGAAGGHDPLGSEHLQGVSLKEFRLLP